MRKRRDRIEKWRNEKKLKEMKEQAEQPQTSQTTGKAWNLEDEDDEEEDEETRNKKAADLSIAGATAKQQLQMKRDAIIQQKQEQQQIQEQQMREREQEMLSKQQALENEEDPLDAYMKEISKAAKNLIKSDSASKKVSVVSALKTVVKTEPQEKKEPIVKEDELTTSKIKIVEGAAKTSKDKGDIMEQDIDGLEYLSDEEGGTAEAEDVSTLKPKNKSEMISTDHTKVFYRPFRKNFYVEVPEIKEMTQERMFLFNYFY